MPVYQARIGLGQLLAMPRLALHRLGLVAQKVNLIGGFHHDFARARDAKTLLSTAFCFKLGHLNLNQMG